jgi:hypothetical protein
VTTYTAQSIVFIDSRVPDLQGLLDGLQPGEQAFVIDSASDGVQQIADILAANNITDLSSISIVGHGGSGEMELGSSSITDSNLGAHSNALAEIGSALGPNGRARFPRRSAARPRRRLFRRSIPTRSGPASQMQGPSARSASIPSTIKSISPRTPSPPAPTGASPISIG